MGNRSCAVCGAPLTYVANTTRPDGPFPGWPICTVDMNHNCMGKNKCDQSEAFKDMLAALESIVRNGTFFLSTIELDQYADNAIDGEELECMIRAAIDKAHKEIGE